MEKRLEWVLQFNLSRGGRNFEIYKCLCDADIFLLWDDDKQEQVRLMEGRNGAEMLEKLIEFIV